MKKKIQDGTRVFCDGVFLVWDEENPDDKHWFLDGIEGSVYLDGEPITYEYNDKDECWYRE